MTSTQNSRPYANDTDAVLSYKLREATRRRNNARGPSAAQSADRTMVRIQAEQARRNA